MKAVLLAGGFGTRLRPLTVNTPKPIVPIFDRPFLYHQIDVLKRLPEIDEVILSLNYQPDRIRAQVGDGAGAGLPIRYVVEPDPRGTGGAIKYSEPHLDGTTIVFNGDVLTGIDLGALVELHRDRRARATIVLTPVDDPAAYGLVETAPDGRVLRFVEKPESDQIRCNTINAGIYVLEPETFDRIPSDTKYSIERSYFPSLVERGETFVAHVERGYWRDIGTPASYRQAHRDILDGRCAAPPFAGAAAGNRVVADGATLEAGARVEGPCYVAPGATVRRGARIGAGSVVGRSVVVGADAMIDGAILWPDTVVGDGALVREAIVGHRCRIGAHAELGPSVVLGDDSHVTPYTRAGYQESAP